MKKVYVLTAMREGGRCEYLHMIATDKETAEREKEKIEKLHQGAVEGWIEERNLNEGFSFLRLKPSY